jgi:hypothetical protein
MGAYKGPTTMELLIGASHTCLTRTCLNHIRQEEIDHIKEDFRLKAGTRKLVVYSKWILWERFESLRKQPGAGDTLLFL